MEHRQFASIFWLTAVSNLDPLLRNVPGNGKLATADQADVAFAISSEAIQEDAQQAQKQRLFNSCSIAKTDVGARS